MDVAKILELLPAIIKYGPIVKDIFDVARNNGDIIAKLKEQAGPIFTFLTDYGAHLFPQAAGPIQAVGAAIATFNPNLVVWIQGAVNEIAKPAIALKLDGKYGPLTREGVKQLQAKLGVKVDGMVGQVTQAAIDMFFAKQDMLASAA